MGKKEKGREGRGEPSHLFRNRCRFACLYSIFTFGRWREMKEEEEKERGEKKRRRKGFTMMTVRAIADAYYSSPFTA